MALTLRTATERRALAARARALREQGWAMIEIAKRVGVPAPTLYRWAAEQGWRGVDLAEAACAEAMQAGAGPALADAAPDPAAGPAARDVTGEPSDEPPPVTAEALEAASGRALNAAVTLAARGRLKEAEAALRLAERFLRAGGVLGGGGLGGLGPGGPNPGGPHPGGAGQAGDPDGESDMDYRAILEAQLDRLGEVMREQAGVPPDTDLSGWIEGPDGRLHPPPGWTPNTGPPPEPSAAQRAALDQALQACRDEAKPPLSRMVSPPPRPAEARWAEARRAAAHRDQPGAAARRWRP